MLSMGTFPIYDNRKILRFTQFKHSEKSPNVVSEEIVGKVHHMILADGRRKVREVEEAVGESYVLAINILHEKGFVPMGVIL